MQRTQILIIGLLLSSCELFSQDQLIQATNFNHIPPSPGVADLGQYGNTPVNNSTGIPEITIPIYTLVQDELSLPISLSYNANGIRVTDVSSEVGLKWTLNTGGVVSRDVRGLADDKPNVGWFYMPAAYRPSSTWMSNINCYQNELRVLSENLYDLLPDIFNYSVGEYSGSFVFNSSKNLYKDLKNELRINPYFNTNGYLDSIIIIDKYGTGFVFGGGDNYRESCTTYCTESHGTVNNPRTTLGVTSWRLKRIVTLRGNEIKFKYSNYQVNYTLPSGEVFHYKMPLPSPISKAYSNYNTSYTRDVKLLDTIESPTMLIIFNYTSDPSALSWQKKLSEIKIKNKLSTITKSYLLEYELYSGSPRLKLRRIKEKGTSGGINDKITSFNYDTRSLPSYNSKSVDYFGFFNNASNAHFVPVVYNGSIIDTTSFRDVVSSEITRGILTSITYPTGGETVYYYEPNQTTNATGQTIFAPGVRVQKVEDVETDGTKSNVRTFVYAGLVGNIQIKRNYGQYIKMITACGEDERLYYSNPLQDYFPYEGYMYKNVKVNYHLSNGVLSHYFVENYSDYYINKKVSSSLTSRRYYKATFNPRLNSIDSLVKCIENTWTGGSGIQTGISSYYIGAGCFWGKNILCNQSYILIDTYYNELINIPFLTHDKKLLSNSVAKDYSPGLDTTNFLKTEKIFTYNSDYQLIRTNIRLNNNNIFRSDIRYVKNGNTTEVLLKAKNAIALPVSQTLFKYTGVSSLNVYDKVKFEYDTTGNVIKEYIYNRDATDTVELNREFAYLPKSDKIGQIKSRGDNYKTFLWSYNSNFIVAEVDGASEAKIDSLNWISPDGGDVELFRTCIISKDIEIKLGQLRGLFPSNVLVKTFLYHPLFGIQTVIDYNNIPTTFTYDEFGRLKLIKDFDSAIRARYSYNYGIN
ncbi:MAG: hypothetical protein BWX72_00009 [Firmicutes bacterium ADurb.Bin080]|jgi:hypothetical protein|nr:MAG: hypothetical protein BWX72_00009 [Firmicutes bacterium ADurb.Bin080]